MNYLSICSGIEAATQAWHPLGWRPLAFAEIEPFPAAVLAHHHPHVPNLGDFTRYDEWPLQTLLNTDAECDGALIADYAACPVCEKTAIARFGAQSGPVCQGCVPELSYAIQAGAGGSKFGSGRHNQDTFIPETTHTLRGEGFDASEDGTGRGTPLIPINREQQTENREPSLIAFPEFLSGTQCASTQDLSPSLQSLNPTAIAFKPRHYRHDRKDGAADDITGPLTANAEHAGDCSPHVAYAIQERAGAENPNSGPDGIGIRADDCAYTLEARQTPQAIAFSARERGDDGRGYDRPPQVFGDVVGSLDTMKPHQVATTENNEPRTENSPHYAVRRLTPTECERLQGFPDHHTQIPWRGKPATECPDGPRYKALGNSMAVPVMHWIGQRLQAHLQKV